MQELNKRQKSCFSTHQRKVRRASVRKFCMFFPQLLHGVLHFIKSKWSWRDSNNASVFTSTIAGKLVCLCKGSFSTLGLGIWGRQSGCDGRRAVTY